MRRSFFTHLHHYACPAAVSESAGYHPTRVGAAGNRGRSVLRNVCSFPPAAEVALYSAMTYLMLKFLWDVFSSTDTYIQDMEEVSYLPERQIRAMGGGISLLYAVLVGLVMVGFSFLPLQGVFEWLGGVLLTALRWFFSLFSGAKKMSSNRKKKFSLLKIRNFLWKAGAAAGLLICCSRYVSYWAL